MGYTAQARRSRGLYSPRIWRLIIFDLTVETIDILALRSQLIDPACGAYVSFEGRVRNHHNNADVLRLEYEVYPKLALTEGNRILAKLKSEYGLSDIICMHRHGSLEIGEIAVWIGAISAHREESFVAVSKAMSMIKHRLPIWKHEFYANGSDAWVHCNHVHAENQLQAVTPVHNS